MRARLGALAAVGVALVTAFALACDGGEERIADGAVEVGVGEGHACVLRESGEMVCWGEGYRGATDMPPGPYRSLLVSWDSTCAIRETGELVCRGRLTDPLPGRFRSATIDGPGALCAIRESGELLCVGSITPPPGRYRSVGVAWGTGCSVRESGELTCWPYRGDDQRDAPAGRFRSISMGESMACAVRESGEVTCWFTADGSPLDAPPGRFRTISVGALEYACGLRESGEMVCWGEDSSARSMRRPGASARWARGGGRPVACANQARSSAGSGGMDGTTTRPMRPLDAFAP